MRNDTPQGPEATDRKESAAGAGESPRVRPIPEDALPIVPVRNLVLFPGMIPPITLGRAMGIAAAQEGVRSERPIGVVLERDVPGEAPAHEDLHWVGTVAGILRYITGPDGRRSWNPSTYGSASTGSWCCLHTALKCFGCRAISTSVPRKAWTTGSVNFCCANR